jgi:hypothetical protein
MPVLTPGPTTIGLIPNNLSPNSWIMLIIGGTTQEAMMASTWPQAMPPEEAR